MGGELPAGTEVVDGHCRVVLEDMPDPDNEWLVADRLSAETVLGRYRSEIELANAAIAQARIDAPPAQTDDWWGGVLGEGTVDVRWILLHMIEETARHLGHIDILREQADGSTGDLPMEPE